MTSPRTRHVAQLGLARLRTHVVLLPLSLTLRFDTHKFPPLSEVIEFNLKKERNLPSLGIGDYSADMEKYSSISGMLGL